MAQIEWLDVSDITPRIAYTVGVTPQSVFDVPFIFFANEDLVVAVNGIVKTLSTHYTVSGTEMQAGGKVTFLSSQSNCKVSIVRDVAIALNTHIPTFGPLDVGSLNLQFSRVIAIQQEHNFRSIQLPRNEGPTNPVLASVAQRKNKLLGFGTNGELIYANGPSYVSDTVIGVANVDSRAVAQVTSFPDSISIVSTGGYATASDGGGAEYKKVDGEPSHAGKFQSGDGGWWEIAESELSVPMFGPISTTDDSATLLSAIVTADDLDLWLDWGDAEINLASTVTTTLVNPLKWKSSGAKVTYIGPDDVQYGINITLPAAGVTHQIMGSGLQFDGNHKTGIGFFFLQPMFTANLPYFYAERLEAKRCQDKSGATFAAAGICVRGGYRRVTHIEPKASDLIRRTGSSSGMTGILTMNHPATDVYPLETIIIRPTVSGITHEDATVSIDMDAIGIFANPDVSTGLGYSSAKVIDPRIDNAWGRHVKFQTMHAEIDGGYALLNSAPAGGRTMPVYAQQTGTCVVRGGEIVVLVNATMLINFNSDSAGAPIASSWEGTAVRIDGSFAVQSAILYDLTTTKSSVVAVRDVRVLGILREFAWLRTNGKDKDRLVLHGVVVDNLTESMARVTAGSGSGPFRGTVEARNCVNTGTVRPFLKFNISGNAAEATLDGDSGCVGFTSTITNSTLNDTLSGIALERVVGPDMSNNGGDWHSGSRRLDGIGLEAGNSYLLPEHGANGSCIVWIKVHANDRESFAIFAVDDAGFKTISVGSSFNVGGTTDPGSGTYRVWREDTRLRLQNNGSGYRGFTIMRIG